MYMLTGMEIKAKREDVLAKLRENREQHAKIVVEARAGYIEKAKRELTARLDEANSNKVVSLQFGLRLPVDHTNVYDVAIRMLEMHQEGVITLSAEQVRNLIMDEWEWTEEFLGSNSVYSASAASVAATRKSR